MEAKRNSRWGKNKRWLKLKYLHLLSAKGGPSMVAKGFSIGLAIEMFTLPTFGLAAVLILPFVYFFRASLAGALVGFIFGKIIYLPTAFLNYKIGHMILPKGFVHKIHFYPHWLEMIVKKELNLVVGGIVVGVLLGLIAYFPVKWLLELYASRRKEKRKRRKAHLISIEQDEETNKR